MSKLITAVTAASMAEYSLGAVLPASSATWQGRTALDTAAPGGVAFSWEGTQATVAFSGASSLSMVIRSTDRVGTSRFRLLVDGSAMPDPIDVAAGVNATVLLASGLSTASHVVTLWSITDPIAMSWPVIQNGSTSVLSFVTDAGVFTASPPLPTRRLRIIGDSITAGNQISNVTCEVRKSASLTQLGRGWLRATAVQMDSENHMHSVLFCRTITFSPTVQSCAQPLTPTARRRPSLERGERTGQAASIGSMRDKPRCRTFLSALSSCRDAAPFCLRFLRAACRIYHNCCDNNETMVSIAARTLPGDPASTWDDASFVPDAVILALGTNDGGFVGSNATRIAQFSAVYAAYLVQLAATHRNPALPIFCAVGPITHGYESWVTAAMAQAAAQGVKNTHLLSFTTPVDRCGHPDYDGHEAMFQQAKPLISSVLGW